MKKYLIILVAMFILAGCCLCDHTEHAKIIKIEESSTDTGGYDVAFENIEKGICRHSYYESQILILDDKVVIGRSVGSSFKGKESFSRETGELIERMDKKKTSSGASKKKVVTDTVTNEDSVY